MKTCPFCGSSKVKPSFNEYDMNVIRCTGCHATGPMCDGELHAQEKWDTRVTWNTCFKNIGKIEGPILVKDSSDIPFVVQQVAVDHETYRWSDGYNFYELTQFKAWSSLGI